MALREMEMHGSWERELSEDREQLVINSWLPGSYIRQGAHTLS